MAVRVPIGKLWPRGLIPSDYVRNAASVSSNAGQSLAAYCNMVAGKRRKVLAIGGDNPGDVVGSGSLAEVGRGWFKTSPGDGGNIRFWAIVLPADSADASKDPSLFCQLKANGTGPSINQPTIHVQRRKTASAGTADLRLVGQLWSGGGATTKLDPDTEYSFEIQANDYCKVVSILVYEEPRSIIEATSLPSSDMVVVPEFLNPRVPLHDISIGDIQFTINELWDRQAPQLAHYGNFEGSGGGISTTSATYINIFDASVSDWSTTSPGYPIRRYRCDTLSSTNIPCKIAVQASGNGTISVRKAAGVDLCTISVGAFAWSTNTFNLDGSASSGEKLDILMKSAAGTTTIFGLSIYEVN